MHKLKFLYILLTITSFFIISIGFFNYDSIFYSLLIVGVYTTIFFKYLLSQNTEIQIVYVFFFGFVIRFFLMHIDVNIEEIDMGDCRDFRESGEYFFYTNKISFRGYDTFNGTTLLMGIINKIFGPHRVIIQYFNALSFMTAAYLTYKILCGFSLPSKLKLILMLWMIFSPQNIKNTSISNREGFISLCVAFSMYSFYLFLMYRTIKPLILSFISVFLGCLLHSGVIALLAGYIFYLSIYDNRKKEYNLNAISVFYFVLTLTPLLIILITFGDTLLGKFGSIESTNDITYRVLRAGGGGADYEVPFGDNILATPLRAIYFLLSPMPWYWRGISDIIAFGICSIPHILIIMFYRKNIKYITKNKKTFCQLLIVSAIAISFVFGWGCKNAGTAIRHRDKFISLYTVVLGLTLSHKYEKQNSTYPTVLRKIS